MVHDHRMRRLLGKLLKSRAGGILLGMCLVLSPALFFPLGCSQNNRTLTHSGNEPVMRVRIAAATDLVQISATRPPLYKTASDPTLRILNLPPNVNYPITLSGGSWRIGQTAVGSGELTIIPGDSADDGSVSINSIAYHGRFRLVPLPSGHFDAVNDVDIESYLCGVLQAELPANWDVEAYKAQAVAARTYAYYHHKMASPSQDFDVNSDTSSQMYGGIGAETAKSIEAVQKTTGMVVAYGPPGHEQVFEAFFSSCCGGVTQSASDAFKMPYLEPLKAQANYGLCSASPKFNWGPVVIRKDELVRRFRIWGTRKNNSLRNIAGIADISIAAVNQFGRPARFQIGDTRQNPYNISSEEFRTAVNTDAPPVGASGPTTLYSSFCKVITDADSIRFVEGHGSGHGVGLCQYCAEKRAEMGLTFDEIVRNAYPGAILATIVR